MNCFASCTNCFLNLVCFYFVRVIVVVELEKTMFRAYDIRGMVNDKELNENSINLIGKAFAAMLKKRKVKDCIVGYDARSYSEPFSRALIKGLIVSGINVFNIGMVSSPVCYFSQYALKKKGIAVITASHNPNGWSGLKLGFDYSSTLLPDEVQEVYNTIKNEAFVKGKGKETKKNIVPKYISDLVKRVKIKKKLKIVVNARNGVAGAIYPKLLRKAGMKVIEQYCNIDFSFPHGDANPSLESMMLELSEKVLQEKADLGIAFDADGDRIGACDEKGNTIYPDKILVLLARNVLKKQPGSSIIFDVKSTQALPEDIAAHGGKPVFWITGHSFIKSKMHELNSPLAGERSGHIFFAQDYYGYDDACFAALKLLQCIAIENKPLSEIVKTIPLYFASEVIHASCPDNIKKEVLVRVIEHFKKKFPKVIDVDGARVIFSDGWGLVRISSNLPVFVFVFEAKTQQRLIEIQEIFKKEMENFPEVSKDWHNG